MLSRILPRHPAPCEGATVKGEEQKQKINELMAIMRCPKGFQCVESGAKEVCKALDIGMKSFLKCLENDARGCQFSISYGDSYYCKCPLRLFMAKKLGD